MSEDKVKVKVTDHHFKSHFKVGDTTVNDSEPAEVKPNVTVRNAVQAGTLELVEGSLAPEQDEKSFQGDEPGGEKTETVDDTEKNLEDYTVDELREKCEEQGLKKSGTKDELIQRLKNQ